MTHPIPETLKPIAEAPEGVLLMLWNDESNIVSSVPYKADSGGQIWFNEFKTKPSSDIRKNATHFTLWPVLPKPKNSWDEYLTKEGSFMTGGVGYICPNIKEDIRIKKIRALQDFLNHHYPKGTDNA